MKWSLAWKWVIVSLIIESFMLSVMVIRNVNQLSDNLLTQTNIRLNEQKILLQSALSAPLAQMDYATIESILQETKTIPNIVYMVVQDSKANSVASVGWDERKQLPKIENNPFDTLVLADERYDTSIPITLSTQKLGEVYLGLSTSFYIKARNEMIIKSIFIAIVELLLSAILLITISKWITRNLTKLTFSANAIANGDYSRRLDLSDSKETAQLEFAFNSMINNIKSKIKALEDANNEQKRLSCGLEVELEKNRQQNILLEQQSRLAILGEMIGHIAHQWRQPLNTITTYVSGLKLKKDLKMLEDGDIDEMVINVIKNANYLSDTIDDFRNFIKNDSDIEDFIVQRSFTKAREITSSVLKENYIELQIINNDGDLHCLGFENELTQVFINIINNAKDILIEKNIEQKIICIVFYKEEERIKITIQDNAGGIPENIMAKIFDPYFTTKHQSQGTGLGLYMCAKIIKDHFSGSIFVKNEDIIFNDVIYKGAKFYIELIPNTYN